MDGWVGRVLKKTEQSGSVIAQKKRLSLKAQFQGVFWIEISRLFVRIGPFLASGNRHWVVPETLLCQIHKKWVYSQPPRMLFSAFRSSRQPIDLWDAVKGSQQGNGGSFIFHGWRRKSERLDLSGSDSPKWGDKQIAAPPPLTFNFVDWQHWTDTQLLSSFFIRVRRRETLRRYRIPHMDQDGTLELFQCN